MTSMGQTSSRSSTIHPSFSSCVPFTPVLPTSTKNRSPTSHIMKLLATAASSLVLLLPLLQGAQAGPDSECPSFFYENGFVADAGLLSESVSGGSVDSSDAADGACATWEVVKTCDALYQTRMRIYQSSKDSGLYAVAFRPTQQTPEGGAIHDQRRMVPCSFMQGGNCTGLVHDRFQVAFTQMLDKCHAEVGQLKGKKVIVTGHSLGGAFSIFMSLKLWQDMNTLPTLALGWAGPFIGDEAFAKAYQYPLKKKLGDAWWQVEDVIPASGWNGEEVDGTVEGYNVDEDGHSPERLFIERDAICGVHIPRQVPGSYGMHDLNNYRSVLKGQNCTLHF